jgi:hypothetical protein
MADIVEAQCNFKTCENGDGTQMNIWASPPSAGQRLQLGNYVLGFALDLRPGTTMAQAEKLEALLDELVEQIRNVNEHESPSPVIGIQSQGHGPVN